MIFNWGKIWMLKSNFWTTVFWTWKPKPAIFFMSFKFLVFTIRIFLCPKKHRLNDNMMMQSKKSIKQWRFGLRPVKTSNVSQRRGMQPCRYDLYNTLVLLTKIIFILLFIQMRRARGFYLTQIVAEIKWGQKCEGNCGLWVLIEISKKKIFWNFLKNCCSRLRVNC